MLGCRRSSGAARSTSLRGIGLQDATSKRCPRGLSHLGTAARGCCCSALCTEEHPGLLACPENFVEGKTQIKRSQLGAGWQQTAHTDNKLARRRPRLQGTARSQQTDRLLVLTNGSVPWPSRRRRGWDGPAEGTDELWAQGKVTKGLGTAASPSPVWQPRAAEPGGNRVLPWRWHIVATLPGRTRM